MAEYQKPDRWKNPENKLFPHQVGFTAPPHDFDGAVTDFLKIAPDSVGAHGRLLHVPGYAHQLKQRANNFHLLEEVVECFANAGADVVGQVGSNWVHATGTSPDDIARFCAETSDKFETPFHMAGMCVVEGLRALGVTRVALNAVYYWPDWRDGIARFIREAGFDLVYAGNFVDQSFYDTQEEVNAQTWVFPGPLVSQSMQRVAEKAGSAEAIIVIGMPNWRRPGDGLPTRMINWIHDQEADLGLPIVSSDAALYWRIFKTLDLSPPQDRGHLFNTLATGA